MEERTAAEGNRPAGGDGNAHRSGARILGCLGQTGTGKTYEAIRQLAGCKRVIFFDSVCNTAGDGPRHNDLPPQFFHLWGLPSFIEWAHGLVYSKEFYAAFHPGTGSVLVDGKERPRAEVEFEWMCRYAFEIGYLTLAVDEIWRFTQSGWMPTPLSDIVFTGGHRAVSLVYTAQRPNRVAVDILSQTDHFEIFRIRQTHDLDALSNQLDPAALELVPTLPDRAHISRGKDFSWCLIHG